MEQQTRSELNGIDSREAAKPQLDSDHSPRGAALPDLSFYTGKRVLVTGHTGFKGSWLCKVLASAGAQVLGYSTCRKREPSLFELAELESQLHSVRGDVRNLMQLQQTFVDFEPQIVFHLAAQPIVRESYADPVGTYATNVMGTINVLECIRQTPSIQSVVMVTTDKVYRNNEWPWGYRENDALDGFDPYSNSKSCAELACASYRRCFLDAAGVALSTVRAGNVIGGGDFAVDRIVPDCMRAAAAGKPIDVRNPNSVRPFQHVLEPLFAYLLIAQRQWEDPKLAGSFNIGPEDRDCVTAGELATLFCEYWGEGATWKSKVQQGAPHEAGLLRLDCSLMRSTFGWHPRWHVQEAVALSCQWYRTWVEGGNISAEMDREIAAYQALS